MMWSNQQLFGLILLLIIGYSNGVIDFNKINDTKTPIFIRNFEKLHRGPPIPPSKSRANVVTAWIEQKLDHFDETETRTWRMRYMSNDEHFKTGGAIFIMLGGEWKISPELLTDGHFYDMAAEHNAMLYYTEHRFYGESKPTSDASVENLKYLHVKQALADVAHFIRTIKDNDLELANAKVIIAGGSYSATMVVWFKRLYPELIAGGWASSAPLLAKVDFTEYQEVMGQAIQKLGSKKCYNRIQNGVAELENMFANKRGAEVKAMMKLCNNFDENNDLDLWSLFSIIAQLFAVVVQGQHDGDIPILCDFLMEFEDDASAIAGYVLLYFDSNCLDFTYEDTLKYLLNTSNDAGVSRAWYYQTCNEYGWYQTSASPDQPFGTKFPLTFFTTLCADVFGKKFGNEFIHQQVEQTNQDFGGMDVEVERIYMTHGELDPWHPMGHGEAEGATIITNASHCNDFLSISEKDSKELRASKERLAELIREWLKE